MEDRGRADAERRHASTLIEQLRDVEKDLEGMSGTQDIPPLQAERDLQMVLRRARDGLRTSSACLELVLEQLPLLSWTTDADLQLTSCSGTSIRAMGWEDGQALGRHLEDLEAFSGSRDLISAHRQALRGEAANLETKIGGRSHRCWVRPIEGREGEVVGSVGLALGARLPLQTMTAATGAADESVIDVEETRTGVRAELEAMHRDQLSSSRPDGDRLATHQHLEGERSCYRQLTGLSPDCDLLTNEKGIIKDANQTADELLGTSTVSLSGKQLTDYVAPEDRTRLIELLEQASSAEPGSRLETELVIRPAHGDPFGAWVSVSKPDKATEEGVGHLDETDELALRIHRQAEPLDGVLEAMRDAVLVYNEQGVVLHSNAAATELYGKNPVGAHSEELVTRLDLQTAEGQPPALDSLPSRRALQGEKVEGARYILHHVDGETLVMLASAAPLPSRGAVKGAVVVWRDVSDRRRLVAEINAQRRRTEALAADLQQERDKLQTIMENTHAQLVYLDAEFNFVHLNTAYAEGAGHSKDELIGKNHFKLFPDPENEAIFQQVVQTGQPVSFRGRPFVYSDQPDRGITYWDWSLMPVGDEEGEVDGLVFSLLNVTEREQLMRQLNAERTQLNAIIENTPEAIIVADEKARITLANPAAEELYSRSVPYGRDYSSHGDLCLCYPDGTAYHPRDLPLTRAALNGETHEDLEMSLIKPDGEKRDLLVSTAPIRTRRGTITGAVGLFRDITERKRIEGALRQYAERLQVLHELDQAILRAQSAEAIAEASLNRLHRLVQCKRASVELVDDEAEGKRLLCVETDGEAVLAEGRCMPLGWSRSLRSLRNGEPHVVEDLSSIPPSPTVERLRQEGVRSFVSLPLQAQDELLGALNVGRETKGRPTADEMAAMRDISQQLAIGIRQARLYEELEAYADQLEQRVAARTAELQTSEARFRAVFEQSALGIALLDRGGHIMMANAALQDILGRKGVDLTAKRLTAFAHPEENIASDVTAFAQMSTGGRDSHRMETRFVGPDDETRWANLVLSPVREREGELKFIIAIIEDVTERKKAQMALLQSEKLATTGRLAASLAHEINNPLQTVIGCLGLAEETMEKDREVQTYIGMAQEELKRAAEIVGRLRDLSRPVDDHGREPTDLNALIESVLDVSRKDLKNHRIEIVRDLTPDLPQPVVAPDRVKQVLLNLILNARDAMQEGGELTVTSAYAEEEDEVRIKVADQGVGIPDEVMDRLFDPFFSTKEDGTGLGLFVSRDIVREQGGRIDVKTAVGQGTAFTVSFPACAA